jgi:hypothetical protein
MQLAAVGALLIALPVSAQNRTPMKPTAPGTRGDPAWQAKLRLSDGRTYVTDGGLAVDAALARPAALPTREVPGKVIEDYQKASHLNEYGFAELTLAVAGKSYTSPSGIALNATYINYLRRIAPRGLRFRMSDGMKPIVVVANGVPIAVLMAMKQ